MNRTSFVYIRNHFFNMVIFAILAIGVFLAHATSKHTFMKRPPTITKEGIMLLQDQFHLNQKFGQGGYFSNAVIHGYNIFSNSPKYAKRFVGNKASCKDCHMPKSMGYAFVRMDRYNKDLLKRLSFEEQVLRCYVKHLEGHVPPFFDPALQDIKIFARFMSIGLKLQEGSLPSQKEHKIFTNFTSIGLRKLHEGNYK